MESVIVVKIKQTITRALLTATILGLNGHLVAQPIPVEELEKAPSITLNNGLISAKIYLPDGNQGFYRGTRFDWAGIIGSLTYKGHDFYPPWFDAVSNDVRDYEYQDGKYIASPQTAANGPAEEFNAEGGALGYAEAEPGETFVKIGVGVLQRIDDSSYNRFQSYPIVRHGGRFNFVTGNHVDFLHSVDDESSGYGYKYRKTLRLETGQPVLMIEHSLTNTGSKPINTSVYNHNFLNIDDQGSSEGLQLRTAYELTATDFPDPELATVGSDQLSYVKTPPLGERVRLSLAGFGETAADYDFHISNPNIGAGLRMTGDRPMSRAVLWSVAPVMSVEPFIEISIAPEEVFSWTYRYEFQEGDEISSTNFQQKIEGPGEEVPREGLFEASGR